MYVVLTLQIVGMSIITWELVEMKSQAHLRATESETLWVKPRDLSFSKLCSQKHVV